MKISTGPENYEILDTGSIITFKDESVKFHLENDIIIMISFRTNPENTAQKMELNNVNDKTLELILYNFNNALGTGNTEALPLAKKNGRQIYLNLQVYALQGTLNKAVHYTWYLREEATNA